MTSPTNVTIERIVSTRLDEVKRQVSLPMDHVASLGAYIDEKLPPTIKEPFEQQLRGYVKALHFKYPAEAIAAARTHLEQGIAVAIPQLKDKPQLGMLVDAITSTITNGRGR